MKINLKKSSIPVNIWFVFFAVLFIVYVFLNKPLYFAALAMQPIILGLVFLASFCGIGAPLVVLFKLQDKGDGILCSAALGIGVTGLFVFLLGIAGDTSPLFHSLWVLCGLILFCYFMWKRWLPWTYRFHFDSPLTLLGLAILIPFVLQLIPPLIAPVVSTDSLQYQLLIPKIYQQMGRIGHIPFLVESNYPCLAQYIYLLVMNLSNDVACNALHFWIAVLTLISLGRLIALASPASNRWLGPVLFFSMPACILTAAWAWNDMFFVFFALLCLVHLLIYHLADDKMGQVKNMLLAGLMAGLASWVKYTFFMVFVCLLLIAIIGLSKWKWNWRHVFWFFAALFPISMLTHLKNWLFTGNPFFPFFHRFFPSPYWNDAAASYFVHVLRRLDTPHWDWSTFFLFPFQLTLKPFFIDIHIGIMPLILLPLLLIRSQNKAISFLKVFCFFYILSWFFFQTGTRSLLVLLAVVFCVGAIELEQRIWKNQVFRRSLIFFLCLSSLANLVITLTTNYHLTRPMDYFLGIESKDRFIQREARSQPIYAWLNRNPQVNQVLLVGLYAPYYLERKVLFSSIADPPIAQFLSDGITDPEQLALKLTGLGVSHIVINQERYDLENKNGLYSWSPVQRQVFDDFVSAFCQREAQFNEERIYCLKPAGKL